MPTLVEQRPWPPVRFALQAVDDPSFKTLLIAVLDHESRETMWMLSVLGARLGSTALHQPASARFVDPESPEARQAINEFDEQLQLMAASVGVSVPDITYGVVPATLCESLPAKPLISGRTYRLGIVGTERVAVLFSAP